MINSNTSDRRLLGFQESVRKHFEFIETQYAYKCIFSDLYSVKFNSDTAYLNIYHERISYEIDLEIGIFPENVRSQLKAKARDIVMNSGNISAQLFYQASNKEAVDLVVKMLANLINLHAKNALSGSVSYFSNLLDNRVKNLEESLLLEELRLVEENAKIAWSNKDYSAVVMMYKKYEQHLNSIQLKRLHYAMKMFSNNEKK